MKRTTPNKERVHVSVRLPKWLSDWLNERITPDETRTDIVEQGLRKAYKLKEPKS